VAPTAGRPSGGAPRGDRVRRRPRPVWLGPDGRTSLARDAQLLLTWASDARVSSSACSQTSAAASSSATLAGVREDRVADPLRRQRHADTGDDPGPEDHAAHVRREPALRGRLGRDSEVGRRDRSEHRDDSAAHCRLDRSARHGRAPDRQGRSSTTGAERGSGAAVSSPASPDDLEEPRARLRIASSGVRSGKLSRRTSLAPGPRPRPRPGAGDDAVVRQLELLAQRGHRRRAALGVAAERVGQRFSSSTYSNSGNTSRT
jgi:hypothetical protein